MSIQTILNYPLVFSFTRFLSYTHPGKFVSIQTKAILIDTQNNLDVNLLKCSNTFVIFWYKYTHMFSDTNRSFSSFQNTWWCLFPQLAKYIFLFFFLNFDDDISIPILKKVRTNQSSVSVHPGGFVEILRLLRLDILGEFACQILCTRQP